MWYRKGYVFLEGIRSGEHKWDHASAGLQSLLQGRFPVIALAREVTISWGGPRPNNLPPRESSFLGWSILLPLCFAICTIFLLRTLCSERVWEPFWEMRRVFVRLSCHRRHWTKVWNVLADDSPAESHKNKGQGVLGKISDIAVVLNSSWTVPNITW